jgi:hypothetical protein
MRVFKPGGVTIFRSTKEYPLFANRPPEFVCTIRGRGRTSARVRSYLMRLSPAQRVPFLRAWAKGECVELPL